MTSPQDNRIFHFPPWGVECGSTKWLEIAHIEPYRVGGNNADDNLRTLCNPCHQAEGRNAVLSH